MGRGSSSKRKAARKRAMTPRKESWLAGLIGFVGAATGIAGVVIAVVALLDARSIVAREMSRISVHVAGSPPLSADPTVAVLGIPRENDDDLTIGSLPIEVRNLSGHAIQNLTMIIRYPTIAQPVDPADLIESAQGSFMSLISHKVVQSTVGQFTFTSVEFERAPPGSSLGFAFPFVARETIVHGEAPIAGDQTVAFGVTFTVEMVISVHGDNLTTHSFPVRLYIVESTGDEAISELFSPLVEIHKDIRGPVQSLVLASHIVSVHETDSGLLRHVQFSNRAFIPAHFVPLWKIVLLGTVAMFAATVGVIVVVVRLRERGRPQPGPASG